MGKGNDMRLPKVLRKLNLKPLSLGMWEKMRPESSRESPARALASRPNQDIRKGFFAVYVGREAKRYVIPVSNLKHPLFLLLLKKAEEEFGFCGGGGGLQLPCDTAVFDSLLLLISSKHGGEEELPNLLT